MISSGFNNGSEHINYLLRSDLLHYKYPIILTKDNYQSMKLKNNKIDDILYFKPVIHLGERVNVNELSLSKFDIPIRSFNVTEENIEFNVSTTETLKFLPGILVKSYGGRGGVSTLSVHGGQAQRFMVLFDDIPINNEQNGVADISQIPSFLLSNIHHINQGLSSRFGESASTGALNFSPSKIGNKLSIRKGNFNDSSISYMLSKSLFKHNFTFSGGDSKYDAKFDYIESGDYSLVPYQLFERFDNLKNSINQNFYYSKISENFLKALTFFYTQC